MGYRDASIASRHGKQGRIVDETDLEAAVAKGSPKAVRSRAPMVIAVCVIAAALASGVWFFSSKDGAMALGRPVDVSEAISVSEALRLPTEGPGEAVVVRGRVGEVCRSAGCWFVLQEIEGGRLHEILVDLKRHAGFTVQPDVAGRTAIVAGTLITDGPNRVLDAVGARFE